METKQPLRLFLHYLIPSMIGMLLMAINILVDGLFVSHGVGDRALAGVNIAVPIYSILLSISLWIGMGGATLYSIHMGANESNKANAIFTQAIALAIGIVTIIIGLSLLFERQLAYFFGANDSIYPYVHDYLHLILWFGLVFILENILSIFVRNDGNPLLSTIALVATAVFNIIFNYIFIFHFGWGVKGAAIATIIATFLGILILLVHFFLPKSHLRFTKFTWSNAMMIRIMQIGLPSFIIEGSAAIIVIAYNITFSHFAGEVGITSYAVINYIHAVSLMLFIGVGAALQPITSYHYGAKLFARLHRFVRIGVLTGFIIGVLSFVIGVVANGWIIAMFGIDDPDVIAFTKDGIVLFFSGYLFLGVNMVFAEFYQSVEKTKLATIIIMARSLVLFLPLLYVLPRYFGNHAIWLAFPIAEGLTMIGIFIYVFWRKQKQTTNNF
ncbi:MATE family efflux transporter [Lysinibacillus alkalisoli]|uniref:Multidrug export protein MepA n=1 Tax=Lysinibacillus alkalisoli TaxID=1911548 RepID=A0A917FZM8_9BACI|nr:MATE family efflux transporter [Lysinibacillus alkalisoli]GGG15517.1 MATE family efflux transporter [Lysinibacillus alkalisoli]